MTDPTPPSPDNQSAERQCLERGDLARRKLIEAGLAIFSAMGFDAASTRKLAAEAGVNIAAIPYYFGSKEGLFIGLMREGVEALDAEMTEVLAAVRTPGERVRAFCRFHMEVQRRFADLRGVGEAVISGPPDAA